MSVQKDRYRNEPTAWLQLADNSFQAAELLHKEGHALLWYPAALLGHHALEMLLKAALIRQRARIERDDAWGHDLVELGKLLDTRRPLGSANEFWETLKIFYDYFKELRYPQQLKEVRGLGEEEFDRLAEAVKFLRPFALEPRSGKWSHYTATAPIASAEFMEGIEDLPVQEGSKSRQKPAAGTLKKV
jgi:HEPN domain-containing protein